MEHLRLEAALDHLCCGMCDRAIRERVVFLKAKGLGGQFKWLDSVSVDHEKKFVQQAVSAPDAFQGAVTEGEIELADETASPESGELLAQRDDLVLDGAGGLPGLMVRSAGELKQATRPLLLITTQPFTHRGDGGLEKPGGGFDPQLSSRVHQTQAFRGSACDTRVGLVWLPSP